MAKAVAITEMVTKRVTVEQEVAEVRRVELELTKYEAETLALILGSVGGNNDRRHSADRIRLALQDAGFHWVNIDHEDGNERDGAIYFKTPGRD